MGVKHYLQVFLIALLVTSIGFIIVPFLSKNGDNSKTAYVKLTDVYEKFDLKKSFENKLKTTETARNNILDSLGFQLEAIKIKIDSQGGKDKELIKTFQLNRDLFLQKKQEFDEANGQMAKEYNDQIWTQLNQYLSDYGKDKGYTYIFGADGGGAIMYADEGVDITEDVIVYVNSRYQGK